MLDVLPEDRTMRYISKGPMGEEMTTPFQRFDFDRTVNSYIRKQLSGGHSLAAQLLRLCRLENGKAHTYLPGDTDEGATYKFDVGGIVTHSKHKNAQVIEQVIDGQKWQPIRNAVMHAVPLIYKSLKAHPGALCIFEDPVSELGDPCLEQIETPMLSYGKEIYHWVSSEDATPDKIEEILLNGESWMLIGAVSFSPMDLNRDSKELTSEDIETIARGTTILIIGAYDGEGYIIWEAD